MKINLSSFSARFQDYELPLDYYHGKDIVHEGSLLIIDPEKAWDKISSNTRKNIRKAQRVENVEIKRVKGNKEDIKNFRKIWFDPEDETIPPELEPEEIMYFAYLDGKIEAGMILTPSSERILYLHNLGGTDKAKVNSLTALLLWNAVEQLGDTGYKYIDVGVSFRKSLQTFFGHWRTEKYPIIFEPPFIRPDIRLTPFESKNLAFYKNKKSLSTEDLKPYFGDKFTILPRGIHCIKALLIHLDIKPDENVAIYKTWNDNEYISGCVTNTIENQCKVSRKIDSKTKAVMVIHEFGFPYKDIKNLKKKCAEKNIPLIEDCAWGYGSLIDKDTKIGDVGDYAIFSLTKILPMQYGAILKGLDISDEDNWQVFKTLDFYKRELVIERLLEYMPKLDKANEKRKENWHYLAKLFERDGINTFSELEDGVSPAVLMLNIDNLQEIFERYQEFGVEAGRYYQGNALFLPIHQNLSEAELEYIYAVNRGVLNLCSGYRRVK